MESKLCNRFVIERITKNYYKASKRLEDIKNEIRESVLASEFN